MALAKLVEDGEFRAAYTHVLRLWRRKPYARLAALVSELFPLALKDKRAESEDLETPGAAGYWLGRVYVASNSVASRVNLVEAFEKMKPDPFVFEWMIEQLGHPKFDIAAGNPRRFCSLIVEEMAKLQDERVLPWVAELPAFMQANKGRRHGQLSPEEIEALTEMFAAQKFQPPFLESLTEEEEADITGIRQPLDRLSDQAANRDRQRAQLFEQVCADFDDDVAKEVFADFLLEEGNPLGEYIVLSLKLAREGELPPELEGRHRALMDHAHRFQPMGSRFERGFAVSASFTDGEGIRRGAYGLEPSWGTIAVSDVPPTSDACHTQSLRELDLGSTFITDLTKLTKPLGVTKLTWRTPSHTGRAKWKKIKVLPQLERLTLIHPHSNGTFEWLLLEGPGRTVRELEVQQYSWGRQLEWVRGTFAGGKTGLEVARLGKHLVLTRADKAIRLTIAVPDANVLSEIERELAQAVRPCVDEVVVNGPGDATMYANLLSLGRTSKTALAPSPAAAAATLTRKKDTFTIVPAREHPVFDVPALRSLLGVAKEKDGWTAKRVVITNAVQMEQAGAYYRVLQDAGGSELSLTLAPPSWHRGRFALSVGSDRVVDVDLGREDHTPMLCAALASFEERVAKVIVRHPPGLTDPDQVAVRVRGYAGEVELIPEERVLAAMFRYGGSKGRMVIDPAGTSALLLPSTADLILGDGPEPKELRIGQIDFALKPWLDWVAQTKIPVTFARDWKVGILSKLSWDDGVVARLWVDGNWDKLEKRLADVPDKAIKHLDLRSSIAPSASAKAAYTRASKTHSIVSK